MTTDPSPRMPRDILYLNIALMIAKQATCPRRQVGCVLVDKDNRILATGYNGVPAGAKHCIDTPCAGANLPSGEGLHLCEAIHAEQNAILLLPDPRLVQHAYVTAFPCDNCLKLLLGTSCQRIVYAEEYSHPHAVEQWLADGRSSTYIGKEFLNPELYR